MFNLNKIEPAFIEDNYGLTQTLLTYINGENENPPSQILIDHVLEQAYKNNSLHDQKIIQHALFLIYQTMLTDSSLLRGPQRIKYGGVMAYLLLTLAAIFWGGNYVVGHTLVQSIDPYALSLIRWGGTTLLMLVIYWRTFSLDFPSLSKNIRFNALLSLPGQVSVPLSLYIGLQYTTSLNAAIYISSTPCLVLLINYFIFKDRISSRNVVGVIASTAGVIYLAFSNASGSHGIQAFGWGDILTIISALSWAFYCALLRLKDKTVKNTSFVAFSSLIGTVILVPVFLLHVVFAKSFHGVFYNLTPLVIAGIIFLIVFPSWLSYVFWNKGVSLIGTTRSEIYTHLIPVSGGLMGIFLLGNTLETYHIVTLVLIVFGIICCSSKQKSR